MNKTPVIIVPLLEQRDDFLKACLESAVNQTVPCRILVVTSDRTPPTNLGVIDRIRMNSPNVEVMEQRRPSFAAAINTGIHAATSERVGLLLSDDWLEADAVELCLERDADIVSTGCAIYDESGTRRLVTNTPRTMAQFNQIQSLEERACYLEHFFLFRREALLEIGGVDESVGNVGPDDFDMVWSLLEKGASVDIVDETLYCFRDHSGVRLTLRPKEDQIRDLEKILDKHGVFGAARERSIKNHGRWFGKTLHEVMTSDND